MVAGEEADKTDNGNRNRQSNPDIDCEMQYIREKLVRLERMLSQKEACNVESRNEIVSEEEQGGATRTIPINARVRSEDEDLRKRLHDIEFGAEDYFREIADIDRKLSMDEILSKKDYYEQAQKKLSILELYRNLQMLEENRKYFYEKPENFPKLFQDEVSVKGKKCLLRSRACDKNLKSNSFTNCSCDKYERNSKLKSDASKLNMCLRVPNRQIPLKKAKCSCRELSSSSDDSEESFYKCMHKPKDQLSNSGCNYRDEDVKSELSSSDDQTTCSEVSKCTCYCSRGHSHGESSEADSDYCDVYQEKKTKPERFRGGLDAISPKARTIMKYDKRLGEKNDCSTVTNAFVDNFKLLKVEELREGLERLKIRNRNLRDFLDTLQSPTNLMGKASEANTICTQVSSCYTFDLARQTRSGLLTVVEVLKGKCRNKDAVIVALADELKTGSDKKIDIVDTERHNILTQDKSLVWNGLLEEKDDGRRFTKKESAIGFAVFLMILISHVKRSEMISYLSAVKKILTESPFELSLFINDAENFSIDFVSTYYQDLAYSFQRFTKYSLDRWATFVLQFNRYFGQHLDVANNFLAAYHKCVLFIVCVVFLAILLINIKKIWANTSRLINVVKGVKSCQQFLSSKIFWFTVGFCSQILWGLIQPDFYQLLGTLKTRYITNTEYSLFQHLNETQEAIDADCKLFDRFDYSWVVSIFCNKFQSFIQFACYIMKNI